MMWRIKSHSISKNKMGKLLKKRFKNWNKEVNNFKLNRIKQKKGLRALYSKEI